MNNLNLQVDNLYNSMLIPIHTIDNANLGMSEAQESYAHILSGHLSRANIETEVSNKHSITAERKIERCIGFQRTLIEATGIR